MKREYQATITIVDKYSDSKDADEAKELSHNKIKEMIEMEVLSTEGLIISKVENLIKTKG